MSDSKDFIDQGVGTPDRLQRLWAPYRMNYIRNDGVKSSGVSTAQKITNGDTEKNNEVRVDHRPNPFVEIPTLSDEDGLIVARGEFVYCVLNLFPYNSGHMMVVPYRQEPDLENLRPEESTELMAFAQAAVRVLKSVSRPDACNVGFNLGRSAGGSVGEHLHMHIVPRWNGDANFMTVLGETKVLPQLLRETRHLLAKAWSDLAAADPDFPGVAHA